MTAPRVSASGTSLRRVQLCRHIRADEIAARPTGGRHFHDGAVVEPKSQQQWARAKPAHIRRRVLEVLGETTREQQDLRQRNASVDNQHIVDPHGIRRRSRPSLAQRLHAPRSTPQPAPEDTCRVNDSAPTYDNRGNQTQDPQHDCTRDPHHHARTSPCAAHPRSESAKYGCGTTSGGDETAEGRDENLHLLDGRKSSPVRPGDRAATVSRRSPTAATGRRRPRPRDTRVPGQPVGSAGPGPRTRAYVLARPGVRSRGPAHSRSPRRASHAVWTKAARFDHSECRTPTAFLGWRPSERWPVGSHRPGSAGRAHGHGSAALRRSASSAAPEQRAARA